MPTLNTLPRPAVMIRGVALFDLAVTLPMAIPVVGAWWLALVFSGFGLLGSPAEHLPFSPLAMLLCNLAGLLGVLWNGARVLRPESWLAAIDARGRLAVAVLLLLYIGWYDLPVMLWLFVITEVVGSVLQLRAVRALRAHHAVVGPA